MTAEGNALTGGKVVGAVESRALADVRPNDWNPNRMTPETYEALTYGLRNDGWLASQALLIWGTDDHGVVRNLIIDGEHRYRVAKDLGFVKGPMVFLSGVSEAKAKALTVAMNQKRGTFDEAELVELLQSIQFDVPDLADNLGIQNDELMVLLQVSAQSLDLLDEPTTKPEGGAAEEEKSGGGTAPPADVRMVQLFFSGAMHAEFTQLVTELRKDYDTKTVTDTVLEAVRRAHGARTTKAA